MKKSFYLFFIPLFTVIVSLFSFTKVKAETITLTQSSNYIDIADTYVEKCVPVINSYLQSNNYPTDYIIYLLPPRTYRVLVIPSTATVNARYDLTGAYPNAFSVDPLTIGLVLDEISASFPDCTIVRKFSDNWGGASNLWNGNPFLYSTYNIPFNSTNTNSYVFNIGTYTFTSNTYLPSIYNVVHSTPPIPPDNYPILTSFYSTSIEKITYLTEEFTSNYIFLSIFAIFVFIAFIELIKRRF